MAGVVNGTSKLYVLNHSHYGCQASTCKNVELSTSWNIYATFFFVLTYSLNSRGKFAATYLDGLVPLTFKNNSYRSIFLFAL